MYIRDRQHKQNESLSFEELVKRCVRDVRCGCRVDVRKPIYLTFTRVRTVSIN